MLPTPELIRERDDFALKRENQGAQFETMKIIESSIANAEKGYIWPKGFSFAGLLMERDGNSFFSLLHVVVKRKDGEFFALAGKGFEKIFEIELRDEGKTGVIRWVKDESSLREYPVYRPREGYGILVLPQGESLLCIREIAGAGAWSSPIETGIVLFREEDGQETCNNYDRSPLDRKLLKLCGGVYSHLLPALQRAAGLIK